jgi:hypothetical protein
MQLVDSAEEATPEKLLEIVRVSEPDAFSKVLAMMSIGALIRLDAAVSLDPPAQLILHNTLSATVFEGEVVIDCDITVDWAVSRGLHLRKIVVSASVSRAHIEALLHCSTIANTAQHLSLCSAASHIHDETLSQLPAGLKYLDISGCYHVTEKGIVALSKRCTDLLKLDLSDGPLQHSASNPAALANALTDLAIRCPKLERIRLGDIPLSAFSIFIKQCGKNLRAFWLKPTSSWEMCCDEALESIAEYCGALQALCIDTSALFDSEEAQGCSTLSDKGLSALAKGCPSLSTLLLPFSNDITPKGIASLGESCLGLQQGCDQLRTMLATHNASDTGTGGQGAGLVTELKVWKTSNRSTEGTGTGAVQLHFWE